MYASVTTIQFNPQKIDEVYAGVRSMVPAIDPKPTGLREVLVVADRATGKSITISLWDTEANRNASDGLWREEMSKLAEFAESSPVRQGFDTVEKFEFVAQSSRA